MNKIIILCLTIAFFAGCANLNNKDLVKIQENAIVISGCTIDTSGCIIQNCGDKIAACAAKKCDPLGLSLCLIGNCAEQTKQCFEQISTIIKQNE